MSRVQKRGLFEQEGDVGHDELVLLVYNHADTVAKMVLGEYTIEEMKGPADGMLWGGASKRERTWLAHVKYDEVAVAAEAPIYGSRQFLLGFADAVLTVKRSAWTTHSVLWTEESVGGKRTATKQVDDPPMQFTRKVLVEAKSGPIKHGEALRQINAYRAELKPQATVLVVHGENTPTGSLLRFLADQNVLVIFWDGDQFQPANFTPPPVPQAPQPLDESIFDASDEVLPDGFWSAPAEPFSWHQFLKDCPPSLKAYLLVAEASLEGDALTIRFPASHAFHHHRILREQKRIEELAQRHVLLELENGDAS